MQGHAWAPLLMMGVFMAGGLIVFFHVVLLWTVVFIFDPWHAFFVLRIGYAMASALTVVCARPRGAPGNGAAVWPVLILG